MDTLLTTRGQFATRLGAVMMTRHLMTAGPHALVGAHGYHASSSVRGI